MSVSKGDIYRRRQSIIDTSVENQLVCNLFDQHYQEIRYLQQQPDTFQDAFLIMTRTYTTDKDFVSEFKRVFRYLSLEYREKQLQYNYLINANNQQKEIPDQTD